MLLVAPLTTAKSEAYRIIKETKDGYGIWYSPFYNLLFGWRKSALREVNKMDMKYENKDTIEFWNQVKIEIENYKE